MPIAKDALNFQVLAYLYYLGNFSYPTQIYVWINVGKLEFWWVTGSKSVKNAWCFSYMDYGEVL